MAFTADDIAYAEAHRHEDKSGDVVAAATLGLVISITGVGLRILARRRVNQALKADDWWIVVAVCMDIVMKSLAYSLIPLGFGKHFYFMDPNNYRAAAILELTNELLWILVATPAKISILCLYNRLFNSRALFRWSLFIGFIVSAYSIAYGIALGFQTVPFRAMWTGEPAWQADVNALIGSVAALDVLTDVMILSSPVPQILKLHLNKERKRALFGVFGVGAIVIVFGIVRTIYTSITPVSDPTYKSVNCEIWSLLQPSIGVLSACLPCLRPLLPERMGGSTSVSRPAASKSGKRRATLDYEMFSRGKDGWRGDDTVASRNFVEAMPGDQPQAVPEKGIRVDKNVEITYERNWLVGPGNSSADVLA